MNSKVLVWAALGLALLPWAPLRLVALTLLLAALATQLDRGVDWSAARVRAVLLSVGMLVLVISPYWALAATPGRRLLGFAMNTGLVVIWSTLAAGPWRSRPGLARGVAGPVALCAALLLWCGPGLFAPVEYRGDEDTFLVRPLRILEAMTGSSQAAWGMLGALILGLILRALDERIRRRVLTGCLVAFPFLAGALFVVWPPERMMQLRLARYSVLGSWVHTALAFSPLDLLPAFRHVIYEEALYRLGSFGAALILSLLVWRVAPGPAPFRACVALLVGTTPSVVYFSSVVYPDIIAVALVTAGFLTLSRCVRHRMSDRTDTTLTVPLLALAVLTKESFVPLMTALAFGAPLALLLYLRVRLLDREFLIRAARFAFCLLAPIAAYVFWRHLAERFVLHGRFMRSLETSGSALTNPALAWVWISSSLDQFGPLLLLSPLSLVHLRLRRAFPLLLLAVPTAAQMAFFAIEGVSSSPWGPLPLYAGFARYQLTLLPGLVCASVMGARWLWRTHRGVAWCVVALGLAWNLAEKPVARDGSRPAFWGDYVMETSGERYPYDALYAWLQERRQTGEVAIIGRGYPYGDGFYLRKYGLACRIVAPLVDVPESRLVITRDQARREIAEQQVRQLTAFASSEHHLVIVHLSQWIQPGDLPDRILDLRRTRTFRLGDAVLMAYERAPSVAPHARGTSRSRDSMSGMWLKRARRPAESPRPRAES